MEFSVDKEIKCPCCELTDCVENDFSICEVCGWENDPSQIKHPDMAGANKISLNEAKVKFSENKNQ